MTIALGVLGTMFADGSAAPQRHVILEGVEAIQVVVEEFSEHAEDIGLSSDKLRTKIELALRSSGISVWDELRQEKYVEETQAYWSEYAKQIEEAQKNGERLPTAENQPSLPITVEMYVNVNYIVHSGFDVAIFNADIDVRESATLERFEAPAKDLPDEAIDLLDPLLRFQVQNAITKAGLTYMGSEAYLLGAKAASIWNRSAIAYGPRQGSRRQVQEAILDFTEEFANDYLSANN